MRPSSTPLKIVVLMTLAEQRGGAERTLLHLFEAGRDCGVEWLAVFLEDGPMVAQSRALGIRTCVMRAGRLRDLGRFVRTIARLSFFLKREKPAAILSWMNKAHLYGGLAGALSRTPALWFQHAPLLEPSASGSDRLEERLGMRLPARGVLTASRFIAGEMARTRQIAHLAPHPSRVVYPGVDVSRIQEARRQTPQHWREILGLPARGPLIGIVGRLQHWKGMHVLVEAMPEVLRSHPDAHAVIVGGEHPLEPDYEAFLQATIARLGLQKRVHLRGLQPNPEEWMQAMDVVVHASDAEPFGMVVIEAMALGKPLVVGNNGGPLEVVTPGVDALLSPFGDAPALAQAITRYLDDPAWARQIGDAAQQHVEGFTTRQFARGVVAAVRELLQAAPQGRVN